MAWPLSQDYNEAVQSPARNFSDPDLCQGKAVVSALGIPMPCSGNFADVYQVRCPDSSRWAVKCFTRESPGLRERYQKISHHLRQAKLPFTVDFSYLEQGIRVLGKWFPILKMQWVEGLTLNQFVAQNLDKPEMLEALLQVWGRMATYLRAAEVGHCDLQHGNVLLVPGTNANSLSLKLIDYDGMWVPALAGTKSGEIGHASYQHPQRLRDGTYSLDVDRFPLLLIATALSALKTGGRALWDKYDDGDNLLFKGVDLQSPTKSMLFLALLKSANPMTEWLVKQLLGALRRELASTPLLEEVMPELKPMAEHLAVVTSRAAQGKSIVTKTDSDVARKPFSQTSLLEETRSGVRSSPVNGFGARPSPVVPTAPAPLAVPITPSVGAAFASLQPGRDEEPRWRVKHSVWIALAGIGTLGVMVLLAGILGVIALVANKGTSDPKKGTPTTVAQSTPAGTKPNDKKPDDKKPDDKKPNLVPQVLPTTLMIDLGGGVKMEFVLIPMGKFAMGLPAGERGLNYLNQVLDGDKQHEVEISKPFYIAKHLVTQQQYQALMKENPSWFQATGGGADKVRGLDTQQFPVETVSWDTTQAFCKKMRDNDKQARKFRLPTEAEWEYACRAGTKTAYFFGDDAKNLGEYAWFASNSGGRTHEVGTRKPNPWGLYDMAGNVWQWCEDDYDDNYYTNSPVKDPLNINNPRLGRRVHRGGSWNNQPQVCRAAFRNRIAPEFRNLDIGIRVAFDAQAESDKPQETPVPPVSPPKTITVDLGDGAKMDFVLLPKGKFTMGSPKTEKGREGQEEQHEVKISKLFYMAKYPVTQEQYVALMKENPSWFQVGKGGANKVNGLDTKQFPVEAVSWDDAKAYCKKMRENDNQGRKFRLPTEAEWEYACRADTKTAYFFGHDDENLGEYAWFANNSEGRPHDVGTRKPNPWGLYDMIGNVWQWCEDYYDGNYYGHSPIEDPLSINKDLLNRRVLRGGSWNNEPMRCRAAYRTAYAQDGRILRHGFRVCLPLD